MHATEIALFVQLGCLLAALSIPRFPRSATRAQCGLCILTLLLGLVMGQGRWQLLPAWLWLAWVGWQMLPPQAAATRGSGLSQLAGGLSALGLSLLLALGLPVPTLPAPAGPFLVGTQLLTLEDRSRDDSILGAPGTTRTLSLQLWYPTTVDSGPNRSLWAELYRGRIDLIAALTGYLRKASTHSRQDAPLAANVRPWPLLIYSHGLSLFPEQNTLLMEHLASQGYLVAAVGHTRMSTRVLLDAEQPVYSSLGRIRSALQQSNTQATPEQLEQIAQTASRFERATIALEAIEASTDLNALMAIWVDDLRFVLDALTARRDDYPALRPFALNSDPERIGLLGMSFGGGAITEVCKIDERCKAGLNLDGGIFGSHQRQPLATPHLVLASPANVPFFEYQLLVSAAPHALAVVSGTTHADFMDLTLVLPALKWLGLAGGSIDARRASQLMNAVSGRFFDTWLRNGPTLEFSAVDFPELTVEYRNQTSVNE